MVGPLKCAPSGFEYIYVVIDKFTKWTKYKPLVKFNATKISCTDLACPIGSSQISAHLSQLSSSEVGFKIAALALTTPALLILKQTTRSNGLMGYF
jgi:hypothetical protein